MSAVLCQKMITLDNGIGKCLNPKWVHVGLCHEFQEKELVFNDFWFYYHKLGKVDPPTLPLWPGLPDAAQVKFARDNGFVIRILDKNNGGW